MDMIVGEGLTSATAGDGGFLIGHFMTICANRDYIRNLRHLDPT